MKLHGPTLAACAVLMLAACGEPASRELFFRSDGSGEYIFPVAFADTLSTYDISFYTTVDRHFAAPDTLVSFPMQLVWRSPSGRYFSETVYYPAGSPSVLYRKGLVPSEPGEWSLQVSVLPEPAGLRGMGLVVARKQ